MTRRKEGIRLASDFLNFLRFDVEESAAATYTEKELDTNLSAERGVMMEIHSIEIYSPDFVNFLEVAAGAFESFAFHVARESKTVVQPFQDSDVIAFFSRTLERAAAIGTDAGPLYFMSENVLRVDFPMPIPYVKPSIFVAVAGTDASATFQVQGRIGYTLRDIDREEFLELLVALQ